MAVRSGSSFDRSSCETRGLRAEEEVMGAQPLAYAGMAEPAPD